MIAIYARQSVEKRDSLSIATQIEWCKREVPAHEPLRVYEDKGYSGANTERPQFQQLMHAIQNGGITKVIVYKLDRISRSLLDFADIIDSFEKHHVEFISMSEKFDTATPIGRAMLNLLMVFAQLERETIQLRVRDNFYERGRQGFFLSGVAPLGYQKVPATLHGIRTHQLQADPDTAPLIQQIYDTYCEPCASIGQIVKQINANLKQFHLEKPLSNVRISRILRNPVYVQADAAVYAYLQSKGATMNEAVSQYDGVHGCTVYGPRNTKTTSKFTDLHGDFVQRNSHEGLIAAQQWLQVQHKMDHNKQLKRTGSGTHSWLSGRITCGYCGLALSVVTGQKNGKRYASCGGRKQKFCYARKRTLLWEELETVVEDDLLERIRQYPFRTLPRQKDTCQEMQQLKQALQNIEQEIAAVVEKMLLANAVMAEYLNRKMTVLDQQKQALSDKLSALCHHEEQNCIDHRKLPVVENWHTFSLQQKKIIAGYFIQNITVTDSKVNIHYKISL